MYDDVIEKIAYGVFFDDRFISYVFNFVENYAASFSVVLGVVIGVKFFKSAFDL